MLAVVSSAYCQGVPAASAPAGALDAQTRASAEKLLAGGIKFLLSQQESDGGWSLGKGVNKPAATGLVLKVLVQQEGFGADNPRVKRGYDSLLSFRKDDGGFYDPQMGLSNYTTAIAVMALTAAGDPRFAEQIRSAVDYLKGQQIVPGLESPDGQKVSETHPSVGAFNYGKQGQGDLSNTGFTVEALHAAGVKGDDPAMKRALEFITRLQNRKESNTLPVAQAGTNDGGFYYSPVESKAGAEGPEGKGLRSYGSMTYTGFKSMLYAGVDRDDPRVQAAFEWIRKYWRLDSNPNLPLAQSKEGLYYYYLVLAKALRAYGRAVIVDLGGVEHNWRKELIAALAERARDDGSWANDADRWNEGSPVLVTAYAVLALQEAMKE